MTRYILKLLGLIPYDRLEDTADFIIAEFETKRNEIRRISLEDMDKLNPAKDGEKIQKILLQMNRDMTSLYEKETILLEFLNKIK
jgi:hypothetical protein